MTARASRGRWVLLLLALALLTWAVAAPTWVTAGGTSVLAGTVHVHVPGTRAAPGMVGAALALAAAGAALALAGRLGRWLVVAVVVGCGVLIGWSAVGVLADPSPAARQAVATATGVDHVVGAVQVTAAPWVALGVAVLVLVAAGAVGRGSGGWSGPSRRHELPAGGGTSAPRGPTGGEPAAARRAPEGAPVASPVETSGDAAGATQDGDAPRASEPPDERVTWDALSRGEDPT